MSIPSKNSTASGATLFPPSKLAGKSILIGMLQLMRPANIITSIADVLAGMAIAGYLASDNHGAMGSWKPIALIIFSTIGLYGGGVVFNDVFDAKADRLERPERPIPSGLVPISHAVTLGILLFLLGITSAWMVTVFHGSNTSPLLALIIVIAALVYDKWSKHHKLLGPLNMGLCRALNLLLGISIIPLALTQWWWLSFIPLVYIAAVTMVSRGEVYGGSRPDLGFASILYGIVAISILLLSIGRNTWLYAMAFLFLFLLLVFIPLFKAIKSPTAVNTRKAVKAGVLGMILMDAAWVAAFGHPILAIGMLLLLPLSVLLAKAFAVT
jgi:4-hydroxybenzoate polyprenyltransferase